MFTDKQDALPATARFGSASSIVGFKHGEEALRVLKGYRPRDSSKTGHPAVAPQVQQQGRPDAAKEVTARHPLVDRPMNTLRTANTVVNPTLPGVQSIQRAPPVPFDQNRQCQSLQSEPNFGREQDHPEIVRGKDHGQLILHQETCLQNARTTNRAQNDNPSASSRIPQHICTHNVPYDVCKLRKLHLKGIAAEMEACFEQFAEADGPEMLQELQKESRRLVEIRNALVEACKGGIDVNSQRTSFGGDGGAYNLSNQLACPQILAGQGVSSQRCQQQPSQMQQVDQASRVPHFQDYLRNDPNERNESSLQPQVRQPLVEHNSPRQPQLQMQVQPSFQQAPLHQQFHYQYQDPPGFENGNFAQDLPPPALLPATQPAEFQSNLHDRVDASNDPTWKRTDFDWSQAMEEENRNLFGNPSFRLHQRAVINATMAKRDVFVLMPTGGGKSLCYQLPAVLSEGVTVVITPLVSLIQDQVFHLTNLGISAMALGSYESGATNTMQEVIRGNVKVLFLTPEKLDASEGTRRMLETLHSNNRLARVVVDEAHCVSQWGHDFRRSYTKLFYFKKTFPTVPILALTATATARVQHDVVAQLGLKSCLLFVSSFNRENLRYEVRRKVKGNKAVEDVGDLIVSKFTHVIVNSRRVQCGIVYCSTIKKCETVCEHLEEYLRVKLGHNHGRRRVKLYHGQLTADQREQVQQEWTNGDVPLIVATLAFGMGINKADVRFVIHFSVPKSLEGYLQESGRAGRDGLTAHCIVYYSKADLLTQKWMIDKGRAEQREKFGYVDDSYENQYLSNIESLNAMAAYCEEECMCRRSMLLQHFGETFDVKDCRGSCDNCKLNGASQIVQMDMSEAAKLLLGIIRQTSHHLSTSLLAAVFRGANNQQVRKKNLESLPVFGCGKHLKLPISKVESTISRMVLTGVIFENTMRQADFMAISSYFSINEPRAQALLAGRLRITLSERVKSRTGVASARVGSDVGRGTHSSDGKLPSVEDSRKRPRVPNQHDQNVPILQRHHSLAPAMAAFGSDDDIENPSMVVEVVSKGFNDEVSDFDEVGGGDDVIQLGQREQVMLVMLGQLNRAFRERLDDVNRSVFNTKLQAELAKKPLRNEEDLKSTTINGFSKHMKEKYGKYLIQAVQQVDSFLELTNDVEALTLESFALDVDAIFGQPIMTLDDINNAVTLAAGVPDWGDDDDDDWVIEPTCQ